MSKILVYTSPARGHLYPLIPTLEELRRRGHQVAVRTLSDEVARLKGRGFAAAAIAPEIERRELDDWKAGSPPAALLAASKTFVDRAHFELDDLQRAIDEEAPDLLFTDINSWGAAARAETSGLPWATFAPYFLPVRARGVPPWGLGLAPMRGPLGALRDALMWPVINLLYDRVLGSLNAVRAKVRAPALRHVSEFALRAPRVLAHTAEPFEYGRAWPDNIHLVGPGVWEPPAAPTASSDERPLVLVTCSTEFQNDGRLVEVALEALAGDRFSVVATTGPIDPARFAPPPNARVERFIPHGPLLERAACVVCHGGMGITQKALSAGVPLCVVPFGRDQLEVARHVEVARAGARLLPKKLTPERLRAAVDQAIAMKGGARRIAEAFRQAPGPSGAADVLLGMEDPNARAGVSAPSRGSPGPRAG